MLLYFLITCFCSILFFKSLLSLKPLPPWSCEVRFLSFWLWEDLSSLFSTKTKTKTKFVKLMSLSFPKRKESEVVKTTTAMSVLDLPELTLELILEKLPPSGLCSMAGVCTALRERCKSDRLWARHMSQKWGNLIGQTARREWQLHIASRKDSPACKQNKETGFARLVFSLVLPWTRSSKVDSAVNDHNNKPSNPPLPFDSIMSCYLWLESGKFWFPAQVYNRENGNVGFMLSCYDAVLSYDARTDTFQASYLPHGSRATAIERGVSWDRLRAPPVDTSAHELHISDCLNDLRPGDHIEIQWRRNKEFPYGWWYGVVGHLESCDGNQNHCFCHNNDMVVLEFHQYTLGSRWRSTKINKKDHREEGNEVDGFYGGIRKLYDHDEISRWKKLWPTQTLE